MSVKLALVVVPSTVAAVPLPATLEIRTAMPVGVMFKLRRPARARHEPGAR